jgi:hypothetical protein
VGAVDPLKLPAVTPRYLSATLARLSTEQIRDRCGLTRKEAQKLLPALIGKLTKNKDGSYAADQNYNESEAKLFNGLCGVIVAGAAFDGAKLFTDFSATLKSNGLLLKSETAALQSLTPAIVLFAVAAMHNCKVEIEKGLVIPLKASSHGDTGIVVNAAIPTGDPNSRIFIATPMFVTGLAPADHCHPDLLGMEWDGDLELTPDGRLGLLR